MAGLHLAAILAGCAAPPVQPAVHAPIPAGATVDGEYRGTSTRFQADNRSCPRPGLVSVIVFDNKFQYRWDHDTWLNATIAADGVATANEEGVNLQGRLDGTLLEGDVSNGFCAFHFTLRRTGA